MATKFLLLFAAALLSASAAMAELHAPEAYKQLTAVPLAPGKAPRLVNGVSDLSVRESRHREHLPLQLEGAMNKIKKTKYAPKQRQKNIRKTTLRVKKRTIRQAEKKSFKESLPMPVARENPASF